MMTREDSKVAKELLTVEDVRREYGLGRDLTFALMEKLPHIKTGRAGNGTVRLVRRADLEAFLQDAAANNVDLSTIRIERFGKVETKSQKPQKVKRAASAPAIKSEMPTATILTAQGDERDLLAERLYLTFITKGGHASYEASAHLAYLAADVFMAEKNRQRGQG